MKRSMKKGYYIYFDSTTSLGVQKKIKMQLEEMNKYMQIESISVSKNKRNFGERMYGRLPWVSNLYNYNELLNKIEFPDFIYSRAILADKGYIFFLKKIKEKYPKCKIVIERPTFPYNMKQYSISQISSYIKDKYYRRFFYKYVDRFVTYSKHEQIFNVPTLKIKNGVCVKDIEIAQRKKENDVINLLAVGHLQKAHGYERCIKGLAQYYNEGNKREIHINIVGDGDELEYYKRIVSDNEMNQYITFYGRKEGEELEQLYNEADIALGVFGLYKVGVELSSALKIREYLAKGLPIISGCVEDAFEGTDTYFYYEFSNDSSNINMSTVVDFYDRIYGKQRDYNQVRHDIRAYAYQTVDMSVVFKDVIEYIKN